MLDGVTHYDVLAVKTQAQQVLFGSRTSLPTLRVVTLAAAAKKTLLHANYLRSSAPRASNNLRVRGGSSRFGPLPMYTGGWTGCGFNGAKPYGSGASDELRSAGSFRLDCSNVFFVYSQHNYVDLLWPSGLQVLYFASVNARLTCLSRLREIRSLER